MSKLGEHRFVIEIGFIKLVAKSDRTAISTLCGSAGDWRKAVDSRKGRGL